MQHADANIVVTPSDAVIIDTAEFQRVISEALNFTSQRNVIVTIGIKPNRPETGYGYIYASEEKATDEIIKVKAFKEKPDLETAQRYLSQGNYFWNAGIFVWNVNTITEALQKYTPNLAAIMEDMSQSFYTLEEQTTVARLFPICEKVSIDYAVMENADTIYTLPAEFGWSDLGSWGALRSLLPQSKDGNAQVGKDVRFYNSRGCVVHAQGLRKVVVEGLDGYIVAEKDGQLLVCSLKNEQLIKEFAK